MKKGTLIVNGIDYSNGGGGSGGGGASSWESLEGKPFKSIGDGLSVDEDGVLSAEGGVDFETGNELALENNILRYKANFGTSAEFEEFKKRNDVPIGSTYRVTDDFEYSNENTYQLDSSKKLVIGRVGNYPLYRMYGNSMTITGIPVGAVIVDVKATMYYTVDTGGQRPAGQYEDATYWKSTWRYEPKYNRIVFTKGSNIVGVKHCWIDYYIP